MNERGDNRVARRKRKRLKPLRHSVRMMHIVDKYAKEYNNGEWFWTQYIGHLYGAIALDFDSPNGWLVYQPYSKTEDGGMVATNTYILVNHERFVIYRCLNPLTSASHFSPTDLCWIVRDESRFPIPKLE